MDTNELRDMKIDSVADAILVLNLIFELDFLWVRFLSGDHLVCLWYELKLTTFLFKKCKKSQRRRGGEAAGAGETEDGAGAAGGNITHRSKTTQEQTSNNTLFPAVGTDAYSLDQKQNLNKQCKIITK